MWSLRSGLVRFIRARPKDPWLRSMLYTPVSPAPGPDLQLPLWTVEQFFKQIGGDTFEYADKFEKLEQVFAANKFQLKERGLPPRTRKYLRRVIELLRRGVITFDSLQKRTAVSVVKEEDPHAAPAKTKKSTSTKKK